MSIFGCNLNKYTVVDEAYIGKTETLLQIEEKIGELRKELNFYSNINSSKKVLEINRLFEKQFGMDVFALNILKSNDINANTYSLMNKIDLAEKYKDLSKLVVADSGGYKYKKPNNLCVIVNISYGFFADPQWTDGEIVGIILHEIGHNFSCCLYNKLYIDNREIVLAYKDTVKLCLILDIILSIFIVGIPVLIKDVKYLDNIYNKRGNKSAKKLRKGRKGILKGWLSGVQGKCKDFISFYNELMMRIAGDTAINNYYKRMDQDKNFDKEALKSSNGRVNEVIADKFAGIYGYGVDLSSALLKMEEYKSAAYKYIETKGNKEQKKANSKYQKAIAKINFYDIHPQSVQRVNEELKLLKRELAKEDIDPKVKEVLEEQISQLEEKLKEFTTTSKKLSKNDNAQRLFNAYINDEFPDAVSEEIEEKIEEALDKLLDEAK